MDLESCNITFGIENDDGGGGGGGDGGWDPVSEEMEWNWNEME